MLPKGPAWTNAGPPSSVWTRFGRMASLSSSAIAPVARSSPAVTGRRAAPAVAPTMVRASRPSRHPEHRPQARLANAHHGVLAHAAQRLGEPHRDGALAFARRRGVRCRDDDEPSADRTLDDVERNLRFILSIKIELVALE